MRRSSSIATSRNSPALAASSSPSRCRKVLIETQRVADLVHDLGQQAARPPRAGRAPAPRRRAARAAARPARPPRAEAARGAASPSAASTRGRTAPGRSCSSPSAARPAARPSPARSGAAAEKPCSAASASSAAEPAAPRSLGPGERVERGPGGLARRQELRALDARREHLERAALVPRPGGHALGAGRLRERCDHAPEHRREIRRRSRVPARGRRAPPSQRLPRPRSARFVPPPRRGC